MKAFNCKIYEADSTFFEGQLESLIIPIYDGEYGVLADHRNAVIAIVPGMMKYRIPGGEMQYAFVSYGMIRIEGGEVLILVDSAEHPDEIDERRAQMKAEAAREAMLQKRSMQEYVLAEASLNRAMSRLKVKHSKNVGK